MRNIVLHIGFPRTGSTFLQKEVFPQLEQVRFYRGVRFQYNNVFNKLFFGSEALYNEEETKAAVSSLKGERILISNEMLVGRSQFHFLDQGILANRLSRIFPKATVVLVIRNQLDMLRSIYCKFVEAKKEFRSFEEFLWFPKKDNTVSLETTQAQVLSNEYLYFNPYDIRQHVDWYIFDKVIDLYKKYFNDVVVLLYEELQQEPPSFLSKLGDIFGENLIPKGGSSLKKVNKSFSQQQIYWLRKLNQISNKFSATNNIQELLWQLKMLVKYKIRSKKNFRISPSVKSKIAAYYKPHNNRLAHKYPGLSLDRFKNAYFLE